MLYRGSCKILACSASGDLNLIIITCHARYITCTSSRGFQAPSTCSRARALARTCRGAEVSDVELAEYLDNCASTYEIRDRDVIGFKKTFSSMRPAHRLKLQGERGRIEGERKHFKRMMPFPGGIWSGGPKRGRALFNDDGAHAAQPRITGSSAFSACISLSRGASGDDNFRN